MTHLILCSTCHRHVRDQEVECPFCHAAISTESREGAVRSPAPAGIPRAKLYAVGAAVAAGVAAVACGGDDTTGTSQTGGTSGTAQAGGSSGSAQSGGAAGSRNQAVRQVRPSRIRALPGVKGAPRQTPSLQSPMAPSLTHTGACFPIHRVRPRCDRNDSLADSLTKPANRFLDHPRIGTAVATVSKALLKISVGKKVVSDAW